MAEEECGKNKADALAELKKVSDKGIEKTVESFLNMPTVQNLLVKTVMRNSIKMGIILAFLFYGVYSVANGAKAWLATASYISSDSIWTVDVMVGTILILVISAYLLKQYR